MHPFDFCFTVSKATKHIGYFQGKPMQVTLDRDYDVWPTMPSCCGTPPTRKRTTLPVIRDGDDVKLPPSNCVRDASAFATTLSAHGA